MAGFEFGNVENVVNHLHQRPGGITHPGGAFTLAIIQPGLQENVGHADDAVHRCPDFMCHIGQEAGFGPIGVFRLFPRCLGLDPGGFGARLRLFALGDVGVGAHHAAAGQGGAAYLHHGTARAGPLIHMRHVQETA